MATTGITVEELFKQPRPDDESAISYTGKQVQIIRAAVQNPGITPQELSDFISESDEYVSEASPTYVRNVLGRFS